MAQSKTPEVVTKSSFSSFSGTETFEWLKAGGYSPKLLEAWSAEPDERMSGQELLTVDDDFLMEAGVPEDERAKLLAALKAIAGTYVYRSMKMHTHSSVTNCIIDCTFVLCFDEKQAKELHRPQPPLPELPPRPLKNKRKAAKKKTITSHLISSHCVESHTHARARARCLRVVSLLSLFSTLA